MILVCIGCADSIVISTGSLGNAVPLNIGCWSVNFSSAFGVWIDGDEEAEACLIEGSDKKPDGEAVNSPDGEASREPDEDAVSVPDSEAVCTDINEEPVTKL